MVLAVRGTLTAMAVIYVLLAIQAETVTKVLGFICAGLLVTALLMSKVERNDDA
mgnify:CR=1 FL=1